MIFEMRTDYSGGIPTEDTDLVTACLLPGFSWSVAWIKSGVGEIPFFVSSVDDHGQKTADYRTLRYYFMIESDQEKVRRALGAPESEKHLILRRMHVPDTEKHLLELKPEDIPDEDETERRFVEDAKYSTEFEYGTLDELGVTNFIAWAKELEDPFHERILS